MKFPRNRVNINRGADCGIRMETAVKRGARGGRKIPMATAITDSTAEPRSGIGVIEWCAGRFGSTASVVTGWFDTITK